MSPFQETTVQRSYTLFTTRLSKCTHTSTQSQRHHPSAAQTPKSRTTEKDEISRISSTHILRQLKSHHRRYMYLTTDYFTAYLLTIPLILSSAASLGSIYLHTPAVPPSLADSSNVITLSAPHVSDAADCPTNPKVQHRSALSRVC